MAENERAAMLRRRRSGIGGSDVGAILGVDRYRDALDVYLDKVQGGDHEETPEMQRGRYLESVVTQLYQDHTGRRLKPGKFRRHREHDFLIAHPDRIIVAKDRPPHADVRDGAGVLEAKTANRFVFARMRTEGLPQSYVLQLQHYMGCCGVKWGAFAILCPDPWQFETFELEFDEHLFDQVAPVLHQFWHGNVLQRVPPIPPEVDWSDAPEVGSEEILVKVEDHDAMLAEWIPTMAYYREAHEMRKAGEQAEEVAKTMLKALMVDADGKPAHGVYQGPDERVYFRVQPGRRSLDQRALEAMEPLDPIAMAALLMQAGLDTDTIETLFGAAKLDFAKFEKQGKPFETLRIYDTHEEEGA